MEQFVDLHKQADFISQSASQRLGAIEWQNNANAAVPEDKYGSNGLDLERIKQQIIKRVQSYTIDQINLELMRDNKLVLTEEEKRYAEQQKKAFLIKKGVKVASEYRSLKQLSEQQKRERAEALQRRAELRESGMVAKTKTGRKYILYCDQFEDARLTSRRYNARLAEIARDFSDRRGTLQRTKRYVKPTVYRVQRKNKAKRM